MSYTELLATFTEDALPDLTTVTQGAIELFEQTAVPITESIPPSTLVIGSGNALSVGRIISHEKAFYADETNYKDVLADKKGMIDRVLLISASGGKHSIEIAAWVKESGVPLVLYTNTATPRAGEYIPTENIVVFPKNREPYTYNVSTYLGMILAQTKERAGDLGHHIATLLPTLPKNFASYDSFFFLLPASHRLVAPMLLTKFDELFGSRVSARAFTIEEAKHAKTLISNEKELFISIGVPHNPFAENTLFIPMPASSDYAAYMCTAYAIIGMIQAQHPPYYMEHIREYVRRSSEVFGHEIPVIVT